jgi:hypothetical protein
MVHPAGGRSAVLFDLGINGSVEMKLQWSSAMVEQAYPNVQLQLTEVWQNLRTKSLEELLPIRTIVPQVAIYRGVEVMVDSVIQWNSGLGGFVHTVIIYNKDGSVKNNVSQFLGKRY